MYILYMYVVAFYIPPNAQANLYIPTKSSLVFTANNNNTTRSRFSLLIFMLKIRAIRIGSRF